MLGIRLKNQKSLSPFLKLYKAQKKPSLIYCKDLTSAVNRIVSDSEVRQILITSLAFENANSEYRKDE